MSAAAVDLGPVPEFCLAQAAAVLIRPNASSIRVPTLAHHVAGVTGRSLVDRRASSVGILCHMRPHIQRAQLLDKSRRRRRPCLPTATAPPAGRHFTQKAADPRDQKMHTKWGAFGRDRRTHRGDAACRRAYRYSRHYQPAPAGERGDRRWKGPALCRRDPIVHSARPPVRGDRHIADQLPPAALHPLHAGSGTRQDRADPGPTRMRWPPATASFPPATPA